MTWPSWGKSWGKSWGASWGYQDQPSVGGGMSGKGWARERQIHEAALEEIEKDRRLREAQQIIRDIGVKGADVAQAINSYQIGGIELDQLIKKQIILAELAKTHAEFAKEINLAQNAIKEYLKDEQEAIDVLFAALDDDLQFLEVTIGLKR